MPIVRHGFKLVCDACKHEHHRLFYTLTEVWQEAKFYGWTRDKDTYFCPYCSKERGK